MPEAIRVNVSVRVDLEEMARLFSPEQVAAFMTGVTAVLTAGGHFQEEAAT